MISWLFKDAKAYIKVNETLSIPFIIERRVRQGCSLILYLFYIVGEAFNLMIRKELSLKLIKRIQPLLVQR